MTKREAERQRAGVGRRGSLRNVKPNKVTTLDPSLKQTRYVASTIGGPAASTCQTALHLVEHEAPSNCSDHATFFMA